LRKSFFGSYCLQSASDDIFQMVPLPVVRELWGYTSNRAPFVGGLSGSTRDFYPNEPYFTSRLRAWPDLPPF
jgi:hypothetical protein